MSAGAAASRADALVLFGVSGDLARRRLLPALYHLTARGELDLPVIGVAASTWDDAKLARHAAEAVTAAVPIVDPGVLEALTGRLSMITGDYRDPNTFAALARRCADLGVQRPVHYLAIPPDLAGTAPFACASPKSEMASCVIQRRCALA